MKLKAIGDKILCINGDFGDMTTDAGLIINLQLVTKVLHRWFIQLVRD